eukprot:CAMPEP_0172473992 /NCGR_PEP_ID=MMETSP1065-20121228/69134_1 /TAXON_ID=265537 /ORGANISM="Amphiprora paludosa, Strain CCMP125" /LENGTH=335 /DNA_ID=CAMNT_0013232169 /DNA_START=42 /DNA_END=1049 /DNA_ORIENTATION=+
MASTDTTLISISDLMKPGHTAVVTGASSGIGKAASLSFAQAGMNVWMLDLDGPELLAAQKFVKQQVADKDTTTEQLILAEKVNVADPQALQLVADQVFSAAGEAPSHCHILMNNAGITGQGGVPGCPGGPSDMAPVHATMNVNLYGPVHGVQAFLPRMQASQQPGIIINTGSKQGITMPPGNLTYNMSKAALKCFTEGLEHELMKDRVQKGGKLRAALLVPGWVNTSILLKTVRAQKGDDFDETKHVFFSEAKPAAGAWMPSQVVDFMIAELDAGRFYIICPDHDVDRETDNLRMTWTMQDITQNRPPLSRWHEDYKEPFQAYLEAEKEKKSSDN